MLLFVKGTNGSGKTTICHNLFERLKELLGPEKVEVKFAGSMLSREIRIGSELGKKIAPYFESDNHIPNSLVMEVVFKD